MAGVDGVRLAETALFANGGFEVVLRLPGQAASGAEAEQLGLSTPVFQDEPIGPAVWRKTVAKTALLLSGRGVQALVGTWGFASAKALFEAAAGIVVEDVFYTIGDVAPVVLGGVACAYTVSVTAPVWT